MSATIAEFCRAERISRATYYGLQKRGIGPDEFVIPGTKIKRVTDESAAAWRTRMVCLVRRQRSADGEPVAHQQTTETTPAAGIVNVRHAMAFQPGRGASARRARCVCGWSDTQPNAEAIGRVAARRPEEESPAAKRQTDFFGEILQRFAEQQLNFCKISDRAAAPLEGSNSSAANAKGKT